MAIRKMVSWIEETQMFQRIAGCPVSSYEDLKEEWMRNSNKRKSRKEK